MTSFTPRVLNVYRSGVLTALLVVTWLMPRETAAVSAHVLRTPYNHAPIYSVASFGSTYVSNSNLPSALLANDQDLLCAAAVIRGWIGYRNNSQNRKLTLEILPGLGPATFQSGVRRSTTELSPPLSVSCQQNQQVLEPLNSLHSELESHDNHRLLQRCNLSRSRSGMLPNVCTMF